MYNEHNMVLEILGWLIYEGVKKQKIEKRYPNIPYIYRFKSVNFGNYMLFLQNDFFSRLCTQPLCLYA